MSYNIYEVKCMNCGWVGNTASGVVGNTHYPPLKVCPECKGEYLFSTQEPVKWQASDPKPASGPALSALIREHYYQLTLDEIKCVREEQEPRGVGNLA